MASFFERFAQKIKDCCTKGKNFKEFITGKKELLPYLPRFFIVDYSKNAKEKGLKGDMVSVIYIYDIDDYGERTVEVKPYSKERVHALREVHKIPGTDIRDESDKGLPIYARTNLMEVQYIWDL